MKDELYEFKARVVKRKKKYLRIIFKRSENISASFMQLKPFDLTAWDEIERENWGRFARIELKNEFYFLTKEILL